MPVRPSARVYGAALLLAALGLLGPLLAAAAPDAADQAEYVVTAGKHRSGHNWT